MISYFHTFLPIEWNTLKKSSNKNIWFGFLSLSHSLFWRGARNVWSALEEEWTFRVFRESSFIFSHVFIVKHLLTGQTAKIHQKFNATNGFAFKTVINVNSNLVQYFSLSFYRFRCQWRSQNFCQTHIKVSLNQ